MESRNPADLTQPPAGLPEPLDLPWAFKPLSSAQHGQDVLPDGRVKFWIKHDIIHGVTPRMLHWWFQNMEGTLQVEGREVSRYRAWHPRDHAFLRYARRRPDGSIGPGAAIRLVEYLGRNPRYKVDVTLAVLKLDETGFIHLPTVHGLSGMARMEYTFTRVPGGTLYENCLIIGSTAPWFPLVRGLATALFFPAGKGEAWIQHNVEEVGHFEHFLPGLYHWETGRRD